MAWIDPSSLLQALSTVRGDAPQLWKISYPSGDASRLTNELGGYPLTSLGGMAWTFAFSTNEIVVRRLSMAETQSRVASVVRRPAA